LIAYLLGGLVADLFAPGRLMGVALILTALGGVFLSQFPSLGQLKILYGYWGMTTILMFWAAMIKATRIWGGKDRQGKAFGFLDGGRGLVAAGFGSLGLYVLSIFVVDDFESMDFASRQSAFQYMILVFSAVVASVGVLIFFGLQSKTEDKIVEEKLGLENIKKALKLPTVWLMMIIILTGYCGYKITDIFSLYAKDVMGYDELKAAGIGTLLLYIRPILGIVIGFLADKNKPSLYLGIGFLIMMIGAISLSSGIIGPSVVPLFILSIFGTALGVYAIRSLYFAIMEEGNIPVILTGTAVGMASFIGYTPDIFMGPLIGVLLDNNPGATGHQYVFGILAIFAAIGLIATIIFIRINKTTS